MAVAFDAVSSVDITGASAVSFADSTHLTIGASANVLLVPIVWSTSAPPTGISISWNGVSLTLISGTSIGNGLHGNVQIYGLLNPTTGTHTLAGSWTGIRDFYCVGISFSGADTSAFTNAFQNGTTGTGSASPATISITSATNGASVGVLSTDGSFTAFTSGTQDFLDNSQPTVSGAGGHQVGVASSTISVSANNSWSAAGIAIAAPSSLTPTGGGAIYDAGTTFKRTTIHKTFTLPVFIAPIATTWNAWTQWPDRIPARIGRPDVLPWTFIEPPPQVWFPSNDRWPDTALTAKRISQNPDWFYGTFVTQTFVPSYTQWTRWPDFLLKAKSAPDFIPWTFLEPAPQIWSQPNNWQDIISPISGQTMKAMRGSLFVGFSQVWFPSGNWPDIVYASRRSAEFPQPAFVSLVTGAPPPAPTMSSWLQWPDFTPKAKYAAEYLPLTFLALPPAAAAVQDWPDFFRQPYKINADQLAFVPVITAPSAPTMSSWLQWPDFATKIKPAAYFQPWAFGFPAPQVWYPHDSWPDFAPKARPLTDLRPWSFVPPPAQVFYPYVPWDDFTRRTRPTPEFPQPALVQVVTVPVVTWNGWTQWPDFATRAKPVVDFMPWRFIPPAPQVWYPPVQWPDRVDKKKSPLNYEPLAIAQPIKTPWNEWTTWPDFAPLRAKLGLLAAQQPTLFLYPGTIALPAVTGTMLAVAVNSDGAIIAINVVPFTNIPPPATFTTNPPASAIVSITETGRLTS